MNREQLPELAERHERAGLRFATETEAEDTSGFGEYCLSRAAQHFTVAASLRAIAGQQP